MRHRKAMALVGPAMDGELRPRRRVAWEAHVQACPICQAENKALEKLHAIALAAAV